MKTHPIASVVRWIPLLAVIAALLSTGRAFADGDAKVEVADAAPPKQIAEPIAAVIDHKVYKLAGDEGVFFELWFRKQIPMSGKPDGSDSPMTMVESGALLGAIRVHRERYDFRDEEIPPGVYTMRLGLQPQDGDHLGSAPTRTFAMLVPAAKDQTLAGFADEEEFHDAAAEVNAAGHPSNLNLQAVESAEGDFPRLGEHHDGDHKVLYLELEGKIKGQDAPLKIKFAVVYEGIGEV